MRPARLLFRLTSDIDALESLYLRLFVPAAAALGAALLAGTVLGFMHAGMGLALTLWLVTAGWGIVCRRGAGARVGRPCSGPMPSRLCAHVPSTSWRGRPISSWRAASMRSAMR
jgi:hypothetical protein